MGAPIHLSHIIELPGLPTPPPLSEPTSCKFYFDGIDAWISENGGAWKKLADVVSAGGWTDDGAVVRLDTASDQVSIGDPLPVGTEKLRVVGFVRVDDPVGLASCLEFGDGQNAALSNAGEGRLRYNNATKQWEVSEDGGAWYALSEIGESGWTDDGGTVRLTTAADDVAVGDPSAAGFKLRVKGTLREDLGVANEWTELGTQDSFARHQLWMTLPNSVIRLGADTADGDAFDADSEGIVIYETSANQLGRFKSDRFGLTRAADSSLYYFRADQAALFYRQDPPGGQICLHVDRAANFTGIGTDSQSLTERLRVVGTVQIDCGITDPGFVVQGGPGGANYIHVDPAGITQITLGNTVQNGGVGTPILIASDEVFWEAPGTGNTAIVGPRKPIGAAGQPGRPLHVYGGLAQDGVGGTGGGAGGSLELDGGNGGLAGAVLPGGTGGLVAVHGGDGGPAAGGPQGNGGAAQLYGGAGLTNGKVQIGHIQTDVIEIGDPINVVNVPFLGSPLVSIAGGKLVVGAAAPVSGETFRCAGTSRFDGAMQINGKLTVSGAIDPTALVLDEQSSVPETPTAGYGQFWVKDDAPCRPYFTDDDGTDFDLLSASAGPWDQGSGNVYLDNATWDVVIGGSSPYGSEKFRVIGAVSLNGNIGFEPNSDRTITIVKSAAEVNGHRLEVIAGEGGDSSLTTGKTGGSAQFGSGAGGDTTHAGSNGGLGGTCSFWAGDGGKATAGGGVGGNGGAAQLYGGQGGQGNGAGDNGGVGGTCAVQGGAGGTSVSGTAGAGGYVLVRGGGGGTVPGGDVRVEGGFGTPRGKVRLGGTSTSAVELANAVDNCPTTILGTGAITLGAVGASLGFFGHTANIKQSITGALSTVADAAAKAVLTSIIVALDSGYGLVTDATT